MQNFEQFLESKGAESGKVTAVVELVDAIRKALMGLTRQRRASAWKTITSPQGKKEIELFIVDPKRSMGRIRNLATKA